MTTDRFGGLAVRVATPSATFRVQRVGDRWVFVTPDGNAFWMLGVFNVDTMGSIDDLKDSYENRILKKYGSKARWGEQAVKRLKSWGFNTLAEYASAWVLPSASPDKMPHVLLMRPSNYGVTNRWNHAPGPFKDLIPGTDASVYRGWRGNFMPDVFDPNFAAYVDGAMRTGEIPASPWLVGIATDDADNIVGFGPGPEIPTPVIHPHIAWVVLSTAPAQVANKQLAVTYHDPKVHSKYALRDFLRAKYGSLAALNHAWGAAYTTWDSDGGWPHGKGLLDESGRNRWVGQDWARLTDAPPAVREDLDAFLYEYAKRYFLSTTGPIRRHRPHTLVFGPATLNGWAGLTRGPILRAAGETLDVLQAGLNASRAFELTTKYAGDIPIVTWSGVPANPDSALWRYPRPRGSAKSQEERAQLYAKTTLRDFDAITSRGIRPVIGTKLWAYTDSWGEKSNWGLVTFLDNAYDGKEAVRSGGHDAWGFPVGGEERDYGDYISGLRVTNAQIILKLRQELPR